MRRSGALARAGLLLGLVCLGLSLPAGSPARAEDLYLGGGGGGTMGAGGGGIGIDPAGGNGGTGHGTIDRPAGGFGGGGGGSPGAQGIHQHVVAGGSGNGGGGDGGESSAPGGGGGAWWQNAGDLTRDLIRIRGGGGGGGSNGGGGSGGGGGGAAKLTASRLTVTNRAAVVAVVGGTGNTASGDGGGGEARMEVGTVVAPALELRRPTTAKSGDVVVKVDVLDMTGLHKSTAITLDNTTAYDPAANAGIGGGVGFGEFRFGSGSELAVTAVNGGRIAASDLTVIGKSAVYESSTHTLDASGKTLSFVLPADLANGDTLLATTGASKINVANATVKVAAPDGLDNAVSSFTLVRGKENMTALGSTVFALDTGLFSYTLRATESADAITGSLGGKTLLPDRAKTLFEGRQGGFAGLILSQDNLVRRFPGLMPLDWRPDVGQPLGGPTTFGIIAAARYDHEKDKTGSHVTSDYFSAMLGLGSLSRLSCGILRAGLVLDGGLGDYDSYNAFVDRDLRGDGDAKHLGGALIARVDLDNGFNFEASLRLGKVWNDFDTRDIIPSGRLLEYNSGDWYWGGHLGVGQDFRVDPAGKIGVFGKLFYTRQDAEDLTLSNRTRVHFDATESLRSRLGAGYTHYLGNGFELGGSVAWEFEYKGKASGFVEGFAAPEPSRRGGSAVGELSVLWRQHPDRLRGGWDAGASLVGLVGKRQGVGGSIGVGYPF